MKAVDQFINRMKKAKDEQIRKQTILSANSKIASL